MNGCSQSQTRTKEQRGGAGRAVSHRRGVWYAMAVTNVPGSMGDLSDVRSAPAAP